MKAVVTGPEKSVVPNLKMMCVDTQGVDPNTTEVTENLLKRSLYAKCHAIVLVVDSTDSISMKRVSSYWFREFDHYNVEYSLPLFVVGNKSDLQMNMDRDTVQAILGGLVTAMAAKYVSSFWCIASSTRLDQLNGLIVRLQCSVAFPSSLILRRVVFSNLELHFFKKKSVYPY